MKNVLFICTGNVCRSPMAEELLRSQLNGDRNIEVSSAGIGAVNGQPPSSYAIEVMKEKGLDISRLRSQPHSSGVGSQGGLYFCHDVWAFGFVASSLSFGS